MLPAVGLNTFAPVTRRGRSHGWLMSDVVSRCCHWRRLVAGGRTPNDARPPWGVLFQQSHPKAVLRAVRRLARGRSRALFFASPVTLKVLLQPFRVMNKRIYMGEPEALQATPSPQR